MVFVIIFYFVRNENIVYLVYWVLFILEFVENGRFLVYYLFFGYFDFLVGEFLEKLGGIVWFFF